MERLVTRHSSVRTKQSLNLLENVTVVVEQDTRQKTVSRTQRMPIRYQNGSRKGNRRELARVRPTWLVRTTRMS